jgi:protein-arginine kinase activator protein McsA
MKNRTKAVIILGALSYIAYCLHKDGCNSEEYYKQDSSKEDSGYKSIQQLQKELDIAVEKEDYEKAALLRDKILSSK